MQSLKDLRKHARLSQTQLAEMLQVSQASVCAWERGEALPTLDKLRPLCKLLVCSLDELLDALLEPEEQKAS